MKKRVFLFNALLLTGASLLARTLSIGFRVSISNKIGAEGIGLYQLICTVFLFAVTFSTAGVSLSVTRLSPTPWPRSATATSATSSKKASFLSLSLSLTAAGVLFFCSEQIAVFLLHDARTASSLRILAPSLPFMAVSSCFRGYFIAVRKVMGSVSEQLFEQVVNIVVTMVMIDRFSPYGLEYACCAVVIGTTVSELTSCGFSFLLYVRQRRKQRCAQQKQPGSFKKIMGITFPVTISSACVRAERHREHPHPRRIAQVGASPERALAGYGCFPAW